MIMSLFDMTVCPVLIVAEIASKRKVYDSRRSLTQNWCTFLFSATIIVTDWFRFYISISWRWH